MGCLIELIAAHTYITGRADRTGYICIYWLFDSFLFSPVFSLLFLYAITFGAKILYKSKDEDEDEEHPNIEDRRRCSGIGASRS